jgi:hypothetical protein
MTGVHMSIADLFLRNLIEIVNFLQNFCQMDQNSGCLDSR